MVLGRGRAPQRAPGPEPVANAWPMSSSSKTTEYPSSAAGHDVWSGSDKIFDAPMPTGAVSWGRHHRAARPAGPRPTPAPHIDEVRPQRRWSLNRSGLWATGRAVRRPGG
jgi:hypothetical protein